jgi:hypothetical protein
MTPVNFNVPPEALFDDCCAAAVATIAIKDRKKTNLFI